MTYEEAVSTMIEALGQVVAGIDMLMVENVLLAEIISDANLGHHSSDAKNFLDEYVEKAESLRKLNLPKEKQSYWDDKLEILLNIMENGQVLIEELEAFLHKFTDVIVSYNLAEEVIKRRETSET